MIAFDTDIHAVAGLLKRYFREMPDPLFTDALYMNFVQALGKIFEINGLAVLKWFGTLCAHNEKLGNYSFVAIGLSDPEAREQSLLTLLHSLPSVNFKTAVFLFKHLRRFAV